MAGVLRTNTPSPSVLPTHTVLLVVAAVAAAVAVGAATVDDGAALGEAATRATVGTTVGATVGSGGGGGGAPGRAPHALTSTARLPAPKSVRQPVMYVLAGYCARDTADPLSRRRGRRFDREVAGGHQIPQ